MLYTKSILCAALFFLSILTLKAGTPDSLRKALSLPAHDTIRATNYLLLGECYYMQMPDTAIFYWKKALEICNKNLEKDRLTAREKKVFLLKSADAMHNCGFILRRRGDNKEALSYFEKSLAIKKQLGLKESLAMTLNSMGLVYSDQGDIPKALEHYEASLKIREAINNKSGVANTLSNIGLIYKDQNDNAKAFEYWQKCHAIRTEIGDQEGMASSLVNMATVYAAEGKLDKALDYFKQSLAIRQKLDDPSEVAESLLNIGDVLCEQKKLKEALEYYEKSNKIYSSLKDMDGMIYCLRNIGNVYHSLGQSKKGIEYNLKAYDLSVQAGSPLEIASSAKGLYEMYNQNASFKEALKFYQVYRTMNDSVRNEDNRKASIRSQLKYEYEMKAVADSVAHANEREIKDALLKKQQAEIKAGKNQQYALFGGLALVLVFAAFMYNRFKVTQKQKEVIELHKKEAEAQKELVEEKQKEILDSIRYAKRIQQAHLPTDKMLQKTLERLRKS